MRTQALMAPARCCCYAYVYCFVSKCKDSCSFDKCSIIILLLLHVSRPAARSLVHAIPKGGHSQPRKPVISSCFCGSRVCLAWFSSLLVRSLPAHEIGRVAPVYSYGTRVGHTRASRVVRGKGGRYRRCKYWSLLKTRSSSCPWKLY